MANKSSPAKPLELGLVDLQAAPAEEMGANSPMPSEASAKSEGVEAFIEAAAREHQSGWIDRPLWESLLAQSGGKEVQAQAAYFRARATMLQIAEREKRAHRAARRVRPARESRPPAKSHGTRDTALRSAPPAQKQLLLAAAVLGFALLIAGVWVVGRDQDSASAPRPNDASAAPRTAGPGAQAQRGNVLAPSANTGGTTSAGADGEGFEARTAKLRDAEDWNALVLYASEWTRKEPTHVDAWIELSIGYAMLRQYDAALETATTATQVAPTSARAWANLGQAKMRMNQPAGALSAFERAAAIDDPNVRTRAQISELKAQLAGSH